VKRHEFAEQVFRLFNFDLDDALLVVLAPYLHLATVRSKDEECKQH